MNRWPPPIGFTDAALTCRYLDLAKRRDGQRWIVALRVLTHQGKVELIVPPIVMDEFERNRDRIETSMTSTVAQRFKLIKQDLSDYGGAENAEALKIIAGLARDVPLIGAMTTRNFDEILELLRDGRDVEPSDDNRKAVVDRGVLKKAPFHKARNSVADALLIEMYATSTGQVELSAEPHAFVTTNSEDFSLPNGDSREPHPDLAAAFASDGSSFGLGVDGLNAILLDHFEEEIEELLEETSFSEEPQRLDAITGAEHELFDRIWHHRSLQHEYKLKAEGDKTGLAQLLAVAGPAKQHDEERYTEAGQLGPYSDFELGMLHGKLSALRWVLGSEWDFLDT